MVAYTEGCSDETRSLRCWLIRPVAGDDVAAHDTPAVDHELRNRTDAVEQIGIV
jgi:hypothetical protein